MNGCLQSGLTSIVYLVQPVFFGQNQGLSLYCNYSIVVVVTVTHQFGNVGTLHTMSARSQNTKNNNIVSKQNLLYSTTRFKEFKKKPVNYL